MIRVKVGVKNPGEKLGDFHPGFYPNPGISRQRPPISIVELIHSDFQDIFQDFWLFRAKKGAKTPTNIKKIKITKKLRIGFRAFSASSHGKFKLEFLLGIEEKTVEN